MATARIGIGVDTSAVDDALAFFREHEETIVESDDLQGRLDDIIAAGLAVVCLNLTGDVLRTEPSWALIKLMADIDRASRAPW